MNVEPTSRVVASNCNTPIGTLTLLESSRGLLSLSFTKLSNTEVELRLGQRLGSRVTVEWVSSTRASQAVAGYLNGSVRRLDVPVDWTKLTQFQVRVMRALKRLSTGETITYQGLAKRVGKAGAARAVGGAMRRNPVPVVVPCHRVLAANGIGGFTGGLDIKRKLLALEGVFPTHDR